MLRIPWNELKAAPQILQHQKTQKQTRSKVIGGA